MLRNHHPLRATACVAVLLALGIAPAQPQPTQGLVIDYVTGFVYREMSDGNLMRAPRFPSVAAGAPVQLRVININTMRYMVTITRDDERLFTGVPAILSTIIPDLPPRERIATESLRSASRDLGSSRSGIRAIDPKIFEAVGAKIDILQDSIEALNDALDASEQITEIGGEMRRLARNAPEPKLADLNEAKDPREPSEKVMDRLRQDVRKLLDDRIGEAISVSGLSRQATIRELGSKLLQVARDREAEVSSMSRDLDHEFLHLSTTLEVARDRALGGENAVEAARELTTTSRNVERIRRQALEATESARRRVGALSASSAERRKVLDQAQKLYDRIMNSNIYIEEAVPVTPRADVIRFRISVEEIPDTEDPDALALSSGEAMRFQDPRIVEVEAHVTGRLKVDYSTGLFFTNLTSEDYYLDGPNGVITRGATDSFNYGLGALVHVYRTSSRPLVPALSFGAAVPGGGGDIQLMLGGSLMTGNDQRFVLTVGILGGRVARLRGGATVGQPWTGSGGLTRDVYRTGLFLGVSFNLR